MQAEGSNLILLFGLPRSGTTWVGKIFDSHPDVAYRHEPEAIVQIPEVPLFVDDADAEKYQQALKDYARGLLGMSDPRVIGKLPLLPKRYLGPTRFRLQSASVLLATLAAKASIRLPAYNPARNLSHDRVHIVWKSVTGLGRLPAILRALPRAHAVVIIRHPCGFVASQIRGLKAGRFGDVAAFDERPGRLRDRLQQQVVARYSLTDEELENLTVEERFAWRWVVAHEQVLERTSHLANCTPVWYDDLCRAPQEGYRQLFEFTGLDWPDITARFLDSTVAKENADYYSVFKNPLSSANRWQEELSGDAIERILAVARRSWVAEKLFT